MAADVALHNVRNHSRQHCRQGAFGRTKPTGQPRCPKLMCKAEVAAADVGPSTSSETVSTMDFDTETSSAAAPTSDTWEMDFSSRPILDSRGKKRWELLICSPDRSWVYSKWFPNNKINSTQVIPTSHSF